MSERLLALAISVAALGCGPTVAEVVAEPATASDGAALLLAPFTLTRENGQTVELTAGGVVLIDGAHAAQITTAGELFLEGRGAPAYRVGADGRMTSAAGELVATIAEDGSTSVGRRRLSFDPLSGELIESEPVGSTMTLAPTDTPAKRAAMALCLILLD